MIKDRQKYHMAMVADGRTDYYIVYIIDELLKRQTDELDSQIIC